MNLVKTFIVVAFFPFLVDHSLQNEDSDGVVAGIFNMVKNNYCDGIIIKSNLIIAPCSCVTVSTDTTKPGPVPPSDLAATTPKGRYDVSSTQIHPKCVERTEEVFLYDYAEVTLKGKVDVFSNISIARLPAFEEAEDFESHLSKNIGQCHFIQTLTEAGDFKRANASRTDFENCRDYYNDACSYTLNTEEDNFKCKEEVDKFKNSSTICFNVDLKIHIGSPLICSPGLVWAIAIYKSKKTKTVVALKLYQAQYGMSSANLHRFVYNIMVLNICLSHYMFHN